MSPKDYYSILNIPHNASEREIKKAYRVQAKKFHPDSSSVEESEDIFKEITEAYGILSDPEKKKKYDSSLPKPEPPPSRQDEFRSVPKTDRHSQHKKSAKPSRDNRQVWREHNAYLRSQGQPTSSKYTPNKQRFATSNYFQTYQGQKHLKLGGRILLVLIAIVLLSLLLLPSSLIKKNTRKNFFQGLGDSAGVSSSNLLIRQRETRRIREELYRELIVQPEEDRLRQNTEIPVYSNSDEPPTPSEEERLYQPEKRRDLLEEIWDDVQDNRSDP
jgi:curved DNA-binding protein CbpA